MAIRKRLIPAALIVTLALLAPRRATAWIPSDFTLGPGGKITIMVDEDSTSAGCLGKDSSECDGYSIKIPFTIDSSGDLSIDLSGATGSVNLDFFETTGQLCAPGHSIFEASFNVSLLKLRKSKISESAKFSGVAHGEGVTGVVTVPTSFKLKASRKTGIGALIVKGLGRGLGALSGATVDVAFSIHDFADDSDDDVSCARVPATFVKSR